MIKRVWIKNFKSFGERGRWIELAPLTLIFGPNSSGKSSFLQALMLLKQSWTSLPSIGSLSSEGPLLDLGTFENIVHKQETLTSVELGIDLGDYRAIFEFRGTESSSSGRLEKVLELAGLPVQWIPEREAGSLRLDCDLTWEHLGAVPERLKESFLKIRNAWDDGHPEQPSSGLRLSIAINYHSIKIGFSIFRDVKKEEEGSTKERSVVWTRFWYPEYDHLYDVDMAGTSSWNHWDQELDNGKFVDIWTAWKKEIEPHLNKSISFLRQELEQTSLLGRVRLPFSRIIYGGNSDKSRGVGIKGEHAGALLLDKDADLVDEINSCLKKLHKAREEHPSIPDYQLSVTDPRAEAKNLPHISFGAVELKHKVGDREIRVGVEDVGSAVGQLLPLLVEWSRLRSLLEPGGSWHGSGGATLLVEQPELHLHPALQADLLSLLALQPEEDAKANNGKTSPQLLLETHSEHMVLRLKKLVREKQLDPKNVRILVFENINNAADVTEMGLNDSGEFDRPWPNGFFPERRGEIL